MRQDNQTDYSLVFLHGFPFNSSSWKEQLSYVEENFSERVKTYAPNLRGHRERLPTENSPWLLQHFVSDLERYLNEQKIEKAVLCGLSMGGYIALRFVVDHPDRVAGLILADTRADADTNEVKYKRFETIERFHREGVEKFATEFSKQILSESTQEATRAFVEKMILGHDPKNLALVVGALASRPDSSADLGHIECPTMIIVGRDDKVTPVVLSEKLAQEIPGAELRIIEHAGHLSNVEQPDAFNEFLGEYLRDQLFGSVFEKNGIKIIEKERRQSPNQN